jgi:hypothetical protein
MDLLNSHITLCYDRFFIKVYRIDGFYVIAEMGENYEIQKSSKLNDIVFYILDKIRGYPEINLSFHHNSQTISKNRKLNLKKLISDSQGKIISSSVLKRYINLLF